MKDIALHSKPILVPGYVVTALENGTLCLQRPGKSLALKGKASRLVTQLIALLDGQKNVSELAALLTVSPHIIIQLLTQLRMNNIVVVEDDVMETGHPHYGTASMLSHLYSGGTFSHEQYGKLRELSISIVSCGDLAEQLQEQLLETGVEYVQIVKPSHLQVIGDQQPTLLLQIERSVDYHTATVINELALSRDIPWLSGWIMGPSIYVTHVMIPDENACFECLLLRLRANYSHFEEQLAYEQVLRSEAASTLLQIQESTPSIDSMLVSFIAMRAIGHLAGHRPRVPAPTLLEFSPVHLLSVQHPVLRFPQCSACGSMHLQSKANPFMGLQSYAF